MSSPPNTKLRSTKKKSVPTPPKNWHIPETQLAAFLRELRERGTSYAQVLGEIDDYFKKRVREDDDYLRGMKDRMQIFVREYREANEEGVGAWIEGVMRGLREIVSTSAKRLVDGTLLANLPIVDEDGKVILPTEDKIKQGNAINAAAMKVYDEELGNFLLVELGKYQDALKKHAHKTNGKLAKDGSDAMNNFDWAREKDEANLLHLFWKLKEAEDAYQEDHKKLFDVIISRKDNELLEQAELISTLEDAIRHCQLNHGSASTTTKDTATQGEVGGVTKPEEASEEDSKAPKDQKQTDPLAIGVAEALNQDKSKHSTVTKVPTKDKTKSDVVVTTEEYSPEEELLPYKKTTKKRKVSGKVTVIEIPDSP